MDIFEMKNKIENRIGIGKKGCQYSNFKLHSYDTRDDYIFVTYSVEGKVPKDLYGIDQLFKYRIGYSVFDKNGDMLMCTTTDDSKSFLTIDVSYLGNDTVRCSQVFQREGLHAVKPMLYNLKQMKPIKFDEEQTENQ